VWVPDYPDQSLSGELSSGLREVTYVGPLTTMRKFQDVPQVKYDLIAVLSGPEPERTRLQEILFRQLGDSGRRFLLVEGNPGSAQASPNRVGFLTRAELNVAIQSSSVLISRSGYSTIMDLTAVGGKAIFIPTPGQTEQVYLAEQMEKRGIALYQTQDNFDLARAIADVPRYRGFDEFKERGNELLKTAISNLTRDGKLD
jgi:UDP:flavonoid glycosyltransferase YjiC (YdhE family)